MFFYFWINWEKIGTAVGSTAILGFISEIYLCFLPYWKQRKHTVGTQTAKGKKKNQKRENINKSSFSFVYVADEDFPLLQVDPKLKPFPLLSKIEKNVLDGHTL